MDGNPQEIGPDPAADPNSAAQPYYTPAEAMLADFQATMTRFLETQERVMLASLGMGSGLRAQLNALPARQPAQRPALAPLLARPAPHGLPVAFPSAPAPAPVATPVAAPVAAPVAPPPAPPVATPIVVAPAPQPAPVNGTASGHAASAGLDHDGIAALLLGIVEDRTGYPADMLGMDQGIEADLGIDSIKRLEIVGALIKALPPAQSAAAAPLGETLNAQKTLGAIVATLARHLDSAGTPPASANAGTTAEVSGPFDQTGVDHAGSTARPPRFITQTLAEALAPAAATLPTGRYLIVTGTEDGSNATADLLAQRISAAGGTPLCLPVPEALTADGPFAGLIHLAPLDSPALALDADPGLWWTALEAAEKSAYLLVRAHAPGLARGRMLFASALGGYFGRQGATAGLYLSGGATGLAKSLREEWPDCRAKAIDLDPGQDPQSHAQSLYAELCAPYGRQEAGYPSAARVVFHTVASDLGDLPARTLPECAVILATGGARGITAEVLRPFAAHGAHLVLIGRAALPGAEPAALAAAQDVPALRKYLLDAARSAGQTVTPASIDAALGAVQRDREIRANLADLRAAGATLDYIALDIADPVALRAALAGIIAQHGPIHGVIHGAGVIEDRRITDKTPESWDRVVRTKVVGALGLAAALDAVSPAFFALFGSVAGRFGNSGQTDYATANELLNRIATGLSRRWPGSHTLAVNWGPWAGTRHGAGMVSDLVRRKFEAQEVTLVDPAGGAAAFFDEITRGPGDLHELVLGAGPWERHEQDRAAAPETDTIPAQPQTPAAPPPAARFPLLPVASPAPADRGGTAIARQLTLPDDPWLGQHRIGGVPVLPLALAAELAAEAAALVWPDWQVSGLCDLRLLSGLRLEDDAPRDIDIVAYGAEHGDPTGFAARVELRGRSGRVARAHYRASALMVPRGMAAITDSAAGDLAQEVLSLQAAPAPLSAHSAYRDLLFHGPAYQVVKSLTGLDAGGVIATVQPSPQGSFGTPDSTEGWLFDPGLLDAAAQLAWVWSAQMRGAPALPNAIGRLVRLGTGAARTMVLRLRPGIAAPQVLADVVIADAQGAPLFLIEALESTSDAGLARFCGWQGAILADVSDAAGPDRRLSGQAAE